MRTATRQREHVMAGLRAVSGEQQLFGGSTCSTRANLTVPGTVQADRKRCQRTFSVSC